MKTRFEISSSCRSAWLESVSYFKHSLCPCHPWSLICRSIWAWNRSSLPTMDAHPGAFDSNIVSREERVEEVLIDLPARNTKRALEKTMLLRTTQTKEERD
jgi:hypothetical protein